MRDSQYPTSDGFKKKETPPKRVHQEIKEYQTGTLSGKKRKPSDLGRILDEMFR